MPRTITVLRNEFPRLAAALPGAAHEIVMGHAHEVEAVLKQSMADVKSGRVYGTHVASAPGEAPALDMGVLAGSIQVQPLGPALAAVFTNQEYAVHLEFGTTRMAARPAWVPAAEEVRPRFLAAMRDLERGLG